MAPSVLERAASAAPLVLIAGVGAAALRGGIHPVEATVFVVLLVAWAVAVRTVQRDSAARATKFAERQRLDASLQRAVGMAETEDDLLDVAGQALAHVVPAAPAEILIAAEGGDEIHLAAIAPAGAPGCPVEMASACAAMRSGQTQRFGDTNAIDICPRLRSRPGGPKPALCVPLSVMGRTIGVLHTTKPKEEAFTEEQTASLEGVASHVGARLRMLQMVDALQRQATTDPLTGLANRRSFEERSARLLHSGLRALVAIADVDHFKKLNDTHGHAVGDRALKLFAESLRRTFSHRDELVARLGGEEFAVLLPKRDASEAQALFDRARTDLAEALRGQAVPEFTASFGVACAPQHGSTLGELLGCADRALYGAKAAGRDRVFVTGVTPAPLVTETPEMIEAPVASQVAPVRPISIAPTPPPSGRLRGAA